MDRRIAGQGERCVLLVRDQQYVEIIESFTDCNTGRAALGVMFPTGREDCAYKDDLFATGWLPVTTTKVIKGDGSWMYFAPGTPGPRNMTGTQWFTRGGVFV